MEALAELAVAIITFLVEVTFHAAVFVFLLLMSIFSPAYRQKLKAQWDTSAWKRFAMVLGVTMYSTALVIALVVWLQFLARNQQPTDHREAKDTINIEFSEDETREINKTKKIEELVDVAGRILKRKLTEQKTDGTTGDGDKPSN